MNLGRAIHFFSCFILELNLCRNDYFSTNQTLPCVILFYLLERIILFEINDMKNKCVFTCFLANERLHMG